MSRHYFNAIHKVILLSAITMTQAMAFNSIGFASKADDDFDRLLKKEWAKVMEFYPESATYAGYQGHNQRWTDYSLNAIAERQAYGRALLSRIEKTDRRKLGPDRQLSYDLFLLQAKEDVEGQAYFEDLMPTNQLGGVQQDPARVISIMPAKTVRDYEDILARLRALPELVRQNKVLMEQGIAKGYMPPKVVLDKVGVQIATHTERDITKNPLTIPFTKIPADMNSVKKEALRAEAQAILVEKIVPAYTDFAAFFKDTYQPKARATVGLSELPNGKAWYAFKARHHTTTQLSPSDIHEIGLKEVTRIRGDMEHIIKETGFEGDFEAFTKFLRTDPQFFVKDAATLLAAYRDIAKRADPELMRLFGVLPRTTYGVEAIPSYTEESQTTAYYMGGSPETGRPGVFYANTFDLKSRPTWEMEALTLHEAVPGHHLQIALAKEQGELPDFRKNGGFTAYVEGWGLYAESLGEQMGFYKDPYSKFGALTYEMWRAVRLVVDTGIHDRGWTRDQAIEFFVKNSGKAEHDIKVEVDRYIVWPGQALAYKMGQLKFKALKQSAEQQLGDQFDIRAFHDEVLRYGALPLNILDQKIQTWIRGRVASSASRN